MKPFKSGITLANWILRIAGLLMIISFFFTEVKLLHYENRSFYIALAFVVCAIFLFIGGMFPKSTITILSGLVIFGLSVYEIIILFNGSITRDIIIFVSPAAIGFYFFCNGNS